MMKKLPIGVQDFKKLIKEGYIYVDKTPYIYSEQGNWQKVNPDRIALH